VRLLIAILLAIWAFSRPLAPVGSTPFASLTFDIIFGNILTIAIWFGSGVFFLIIARQGHPLAMELAQCASTCQGWKNGKGRERPKPETDTRG